MMNSRSCVLFCVMIGLVCSCTSIKHASLMDEFDETMSLYRQTLMDSDFESALLFAGEDTSTTPDADLGELENFNVVYCEVKKMKWSEDHTRVWQQMAISYYNKKTMIHHDLVDHQKWRYDAQNERWLLESGLPQLK